MLRKAVYVCILICIITLGASIALADELLFTDELNDFSNMYSHTEGFEIRNVRGGWFDGNDKLLTCSKAPQGAEIIYKTDFDIGSFAVHTYCYEKSFGMVDFPNLLRFYASADGVNYKQLTVDEKRVSKLINTKEWEANNRSYHVFEGIEVPEGNRFFKIEIYQKTSEWNPFIDKVEIRNEPIHFINGTRIAHFEMPEYDYSSLPSISEIHKDYFDIGTAVEPRDLVQYGDLIKGQFNVIVAENQFKPHIIHPDENRFNFEGFDRVADFAMKNNMKVRAHTLMYYVNTASWYFQNSDGSQSTKEQFYSKLEKHIKTIVTRYKGKVAAYDVVNELIDPSTGELRSYMKEYKLYGDEFIEMAFRWAHEADPDAILLYNDNRYDIPQKREGIYKLIKGLLDKGVPISGIGMQSHMSIDMSGETMEEILKQFSTLGLPIYITELDYMAYIRDDELSYYTPSQAAYINELMAKRYATCFDVLRKYSDVIDQVNFWNVTNNRSWRSLSARRDYSVLFDYDGKPNPSYYSAIDIEGKLPRWNDADLPSLPRIYPDGYEPLTAYASYGCPQIDGKIDEVWDSTELLNVNKVIEGNEENASTAIARVLWDKDNLYILMEVKDSYLSVANIYPWYQDCVELFIGESGLKASYLMAGDSQNRINYKGEYTGGGDNSSDCEYATSVTKDGYIVEFKYPFTMKKGIEGRKLCVDFQVSSDNGAGTRETCTKWCDTTAQTYLKTYYWGDVILK